MPTKIVHDESEQAFLPRLLPRHHLISADTLFVGGDSTVGVTAATTPPSSFEGSSDHHRKPNLSGKRFECVSKYSFVRGMIWRFVKMIMDGDRGLTCRSFVRCSTLPAQLLPIEN